MKCATDRLLGGWDPITKDDAICFSYSIPLIMDQKSISIPLIMEH
jgi:hypothetical protein